MAQKDFSNVKGYEILMFTLIASQKVDTQIARAKGSFFIDIDITSEARRAAELLDEAEKLADKFEADKTRLELQAESFRRQAVAIELDKLRQKSNERLTDENPDSKLSERLFKFDKPLPENYLTPAFYHGREELPIFKSPYQNNPTDDSLTRFPKLKK